VDQEDASSQGKEQDCMVAWERTPAHERMGFGTGWNNDLERCIMERAIPEWEGQCEQSARENGYD
jgi:hypothetical protein